MKVVIFAGGWGMRIKEETQSKPKPMVEIGHRPILWHIMKIFSHYGYNDFIICVGYKGHIVKEFFANYALHNSVVTFDMETGTCKVHENTSESWQVTVVDTGLETMTGGRLKQVREFLDDDESFFLTYGDGVGDINIPELNAFHKSHGRLATVTATRPPGRFGALAINGDEVSHFEEKPLGDSGWINGGFFVLSPKVIDLIPSDSPPWEAAPMHALAEKKELMAYKHTGFWQPMDTLRDMYYLEELWGTGNAPWKIW